MDFQVQIDGIEKRPILSKAASSSFYLFCDELSGQHSQINIVNFNKVMIKVNLVKGL